jgi:hypothetical protein
MEFSRTSKPRYTPPTEFLDGTLLAIISRCNKAIVDNVIKTRLGQSRSPLSAAFDPQPASDEKKDVPVSTQELVATILDCPASLCVETLVEMCRLCLCHGNGSTPDSNRTRDQLTDIGGPFMSSAKSINVYHFASVIHAFVICFLEGNALNEVDQTVGSIVDSSEQHMITTISAIPVCDILNVMGPTSPDIRAFTIDAVKTCKDFFSGGIRCLFEATPVSGGRKRRGGSMTFMDILDNLVGCSDERTQLHIPSLAMSPDCKIQLSAKPLVARYASYVVDNTPLGCELPLRANCKSCWEKCPTLFFPGRDTKKSCRVYRHLSQSVVTGPSRVVCSSDVHQRVFEREMADNWEMGNFNSSSSHRWTQVASKAFCRHLDVPSPCGDGIVNFPRPSLFYWGQPSHIHQHTTSTNLTHDTKETPCYIFVDLSDNHTRQTVHYNYLRCIYRDFEYLNSGRNESAAMV